MARTARGRRRGRAGDARRLLRPLRGVPASSRACSPPTTCSSARCATDELRRAIECPAQRAGLIVEPELVDALVADVEGEPGALPLLSTALLELWQHRDGRRLRHAAYERAGGVRGAVARLGEPAYARLDEPQQRDRPQRAAAARDVRRGGRRRAPPHGARGARRRARRPRSSSVLADSRLLTVDAGTVELAHEALLREWPRLRGWIEEDRDALRAPRAAARGAPSGSGFDRDDGALLRGARLAEVARAGSSPTAPAVEPSSASSSRRASTRERREQTAQRRRRRARDRRARRAAGGDRRRRLRRDRPAPPGGARAQPRALALAGGAVGADARQRP